MIFADLLERYALHCMKQGIKAFARSKKESDAGNNDASVFWYQKYLKYSKKHKKYMSLIERK